MRCHSPSKSQSSSHHIIILTTTLVALVILLNLYICNMSPPINVIINFPSHRMDTSFSTITSYQATPPSNLSSNPGVPSLAIIGPPKASTTSIYDGLISHYEEFHFNKPDMLAKGDRMEVKHILQLIRSSIPSNEYHPITPAMSSFVNGEHPINNLSVPISEFPFLDLLGLLNQTLLRNTLKKYIDVFLPDGVTDNMTNYSSNSMHFWYTIDKTPMNFYLPHSALIFGYYLSFHSLLPNVRGTKILFVLRDPVMRYQSWNSMNKRYTFHITPKEQFPKVFEEQCLNEMNSLLMHRDMVEFRNLVSRRRNEFDDTVIVRKWFHWYYAVSGYANHDPIHGFFPSLYYPQLLVWIHFYRQLGILGLFKVIGFDYVTANGMDALHLIQCWVRFDVTDLEMCLTFQEIPNKEEKLKKMNPGTVDLTRLPDRVKVQLTEFLQPFKQKTEEMLGNYSQIILGPFDGWQSLVH